MACSLFFSGPSKVSCLPNLSQTSQWRTPGTRLSSGSSFETSSSSSAPSQSLSIAATTASSSMGLNVHVEYTRRPPSSSSCAWRARSSAAAGGARCRYRRPPGPDVRRLAHGAVARARHVREDGVEGDAPAGQVITGKFCASWLVTKTGQLTLVWCVSRLHRFMSTSLAMTKPLGMAVLSPSEPCSISRSWNVFEPGAAHVQHDVQRLDVEENAGSWTPPPGA